MKLNLNEKQNLEFEIEIVGASMNDVKPRLVLHEENFSIIFDGRISDKSLNESEKPFDKFIEQKGKFCIFEIPILGNNIIKQESINADIEIILNGKYVKPWSSKIEIEKPIVVNIKEAKISTPDSIKISEPKVSIAKPVSHKKLFEGKKLSIVCKDNTKRNAVITKIIDEKKSLVEVKFSNDKKKIIKLK